jgi:hypothetical protein
LHGLAWLQLTRAAHARALGDPNPGADRRHGERFTKGPDSGGGA